MITDISHTEQATRYDLDMRIFTAAVKKTKGRALRFLSPDGMADILDASVLRKLLPTCTSAALVLFHTSKTWTERGELIRPLYGEKDARKEWGPTTRGYVRPDLYTPLPRVGLVVLYREYEGGRGAACMYLYAPSEERKVAICPIT